MALTLAIFAKNAAANVYGYSPNQLEFGKKPNFLSVLSIDKLPGSDEILDNLNALYSVHQAFISPESKEWI